MRAMIVDAQDIATVRYNAPQAEGAARVQIMTSDHYRKLEAARRWMRHNMQHREHYAALIKQALR